MIEKHAIVQFKTRDGRLLYGRVSNLTLRIATIKAFGLGTWHRCSANRVASVTTSLSYSEMADFNYQAAEKAAKAIKKMKEVRRERRRLAAARRDCGYLNGVSLYDGSRVGDGRW